MAVIRHPRKRPNNLWNFPTEEAVKFSLADYRLAKKNKIPLAKIDISMSCMGKNHTIRVEFPGSIKCMHHPDLKAEKTMEKLGGVKAECVTWLETFRKDKTQACRGRYYAMRLLKAIDQLQTFKSGEREKYKDMMDKHMPMRLEEHVERIQQSLRTKIYKQFGSLIPKSDSWKIPYSVRNEPEAEDRPIISRIKFVFEDRLNKPKEDTK